jgi:hypothetical protein
MKDLLPIVLVTTVALGLVGVAVVVGRDTSTLVSPPEAVAEQFARKLAGGRYDVASAHLEDDSPAMREHVRSVSDTLRARAGAISAVDGEPGMIQDDRATASAVIRTTRAGDLVMHFVLVRRAGSWRVASFGW